MNTLSDKSAPTPEQVKAALRGLTKVQRMYVKDGSAHGDIAITTIRALIRKGLFRVEADSPNGQFGFARLTPLGEAVSAALPIEAASPYLQPALRAATALKAEAPDNAR